MELTCFGQFRAVLDSLGQFWTVKDGLNLVLDTVRPKPRFGRPKPNPAFRSFIVILWYSQGWLCKNGPLELLINPQCLPIYCLISWWFMSLSKAPGLFWGRFNNSIRLCLASAMYWMTTIHTHFILHGSKLLQLVFSMSHDNFYEKLLDR